MTANRVIPAYSNGVERLRKWETYAYQLALYIAGEEDKAAQLAGSALLAAWPALMADRSGTRAEEIVKQAVMRQSVEWIAGGLRDNELYENSAQSF